MHSFTNFIYALPAVLPAVLAVPSINRVQTEHTIAGSWIVRLDNDEMTTMSSVLSSAMYEAGIQSSANYSIGSVQGFMFDGDESALDALQSLPGILSIEPDTKVWATVPMPMIHTRSVAPFANGSFVSQNGSTWGLSRISHKQTGAHDYVYDSSAGSGSFVYVIDTGINTAHAEFDGGRAKMGVSYIDGEEETDLQGHGSHCSGTVAGKTYGVAKKANLIGVKVLGKDGSGSNSGVLKGIDWAVNNAKEEGHIDHTVLSMSLGGPFSKTTNDAIAEAVAAGAFIAVAAGNEGEDAKNSSPASAPEACTVGASTIEDARADFSNFGSLVDIFAPGKDILSAWIGSSTATNTISGTSMATPHIAGLAAYLIGLEGPRSPAELCARIQELAGKDLLSDVGSGSPNLIAYNGNGA